MDYFTPERIRTEIVGRLLQFAANLSKDADELEKAYSSGEIKEKWLPVKVGGKTSGLIQAMDTLDDWREKEIVGKLKSAKRGKLRFETAATRIEAAKKKNPSR